MVIESGLKFTLLRVWWFLIGKPPNDDSLAALHEFNVTYPKAKKPRFAVDFLGEISVEWVEDFGSYVRLMFASTDKVYVAINVDGPPPTKSFFSSEVTVDELAKMAVTFPLLREALGLST